SRARIPRQPPGQAPSPEGRAARTHSAQLAPSMTSLRQLEANRRNALKSTGPTSANGKHVSRRNALRHGFTAETVIEPLENPEEYRTFEAAILSEYLPQTPIEQELVRRLASLFWRLRRATSIETGLLDRKSTRLNSSHGSISYAVFCLKKK